MASSGALPVKALSADQVDEVQFAGPRSVPAAPTEPDAAAVLPEPADAVLDIPSFAADSAGAFSKIWS